MIGICMARDEADIIGTTLAHLKNYDFRAVIVADNLSVDNTAAIAGRAGAHVVCDFDPAYNQADKMTRLADRFALPGEFVIPFDADELWWNLNLLTDDIDVATAHPHVHYREMRQPGCEIHPKAAFRWRPGCRIDMGNHYVFGAGPVVADGLLEVCHYQYRTLEQVRRKITQGVAALDAAGMTHGTGTHWRDLAALPPGELPVWFDWYIAKASEPCHLSQR